jgi:hypothetical protein
MSPEGFRDTRCIHPKIYDIYINQIRFSNKKGGLFVRLFCEDIVSSYWVTGYTLICSLALSFRSKVTTPSIFAKRVSSEPLPTFIPG